MVFSSPATQIHREALPLATLIRKTEREVLMAFNNSRRVELKGVALVSILRVSINKITILPLKLIEETL